MDNKRRVKDHDDLAKTNIYELFLRECITRTSTDCKLTVTDAHSEFKFWLKDNYPRVNYISRYQFRYEIERILGKCVGGGWIGFRIEIPDELVGF